jgi:hypothetical protein
MSRLQDKAVRLRVVARGKTDAQTQDSASYLRATADSIDDTANRCTEPRVVSELQHISEELRAEAARLELW